MGMGQSQCLREAAKLFFHKTLSPFRTEKVETTRVIKHFSGIYFLFFNNLLVYCLLLSASKRRKGYKYHELQFPNLNIVGGTTVL